MRLLNVLCLIVLVNISCQAQKFEKSPYLILLAGNSFEIDYKHDNTAVKSNSVIISPNTAKVSTYFKLKSTGNLVIKLTAKVLEVKPAELTIGFGKEQVKLKIANKDYQTVTIGNFMISKEGYKHLDFLSTTGNVDIESLILEGTATTDGVVYVSDKEDFYWTRRGPSCHMGYDPQVENTTYFYNEIRVPKGQDIIGSFYMANGFREGYFGIQVNSPTERCVLFSVWSPFETDEPNEIPEDQKIVLLKKGKNVDTGEFGNEGSGGQSFLRFNWKADETYKFLLKGQPDGKGNTVYTAWFFAPENNSWELVASFKRPKTNTYLNDFHSFLENFNPNQGYLTREVEFKNQWVYNGEWHKINQAQLTVDATYSKGNRIDATGGTTRNGFFLKMGGFFDEVSQPNTIFNYNNTNSRPQIDFGKLP